MLCMQILYMMHISFGILCQLYTSIIRFHMYIIDKVFCTAISIPWIYLWFILVYTIDICLPPSNMEVTQCRNNSANERRCWHLTDSKQTANEWVFTGQNLPSFCSWFELSSSMWSCYDFTQLCVALLWFYSGLCGPIMILLSPVWSCYDFTQLCVVLLWFYSALCGPAMISLSCCRF